MRRTASAALTTGATLQTWRPRTYTGPCARREGIYRQGRPLVSGTSRPPDSLGHLAAPPVLQQAPPLLVLVQVDVAMRVDPDGMPAIAGSGRGRAQPARQHLPVESQKGDQAVQLWHIHHPG